MDVRVCVYMQGCAEARNRESMEKETISLNISTKADYEEDEQILLNSN